MLKAYLLFCPCMFHPELRPLVIPTFFPLSLILDNMFAIEERGLKSLHLKQHLGN